MFSLVIFSFVCVSLHVIMYFIDCILNLFEAQYNLGHCLQSQLWTDLAKELTLTRTDMTADVNMKFLFEVSNNMVSGDDSANKGTQTVVSY